MPFLPPRTIQPQQYQYSQMPYHYGTPPSFMASYPSRNGPNLIISCFDSLVSNSQGVGHMVASWGGSTYAVPCPISIPFSFAHDDDTYGSWCRNVNCRQLP
jgi:hypothetical protein